MLPMDFFERPTLIVAHDMLGKFLCCSDGRALMITEVEAYDGPQDLACHAARGRTPRTEVMFGAAGHFYVYLIYGIHWMLNVVTDRKDYPAAVLIRGLEGISGPARLTKALKIDKKLNTLPAHPASGFWFEDRGTRIPSREIIKTPRIGVDYAGPEWATKPWRFLVKNGSS
ncbi:MAG: DNA-3-methyladenine glycosylase [Patescibacteria group bacterium]